MVTLIRSTCLPLVNSGLPRPILRFIKISLIFKIYAQKWTFKLACTDYSAILLLDQNDLHTLQRKEGKKP